MKKLVVLCVMGSLLCLSSVALSYTPSWADGAYQCDQRVLRIGYRTIEGVCAEGFQWREGGSDNSICLLKRGWCLPAFHGPDPDGAGGDGEMDGDENGESIWCLPIFKGWFSFFCVPGAD